MWKTDLESAIQQNDNVLWVGWKIIMGGNCAIAMCRGGGGEEGFGEAEHEEAENENSKDGQEVRKNLGKNLDAVNIR